LKYIESSVLEKSVNLMRSGKRWPWV